MKTDKATPAEPASAAATKARTKRIRSQEVQAFMKIDQVFDGLSPGSRIRLAGYVAEHYGDAQSWTTDARTDREAGGA